LPWIAWERRLLGRGQEQAWTMLTAILCQRDAAFHKFLEVHIP
jgi:hypothetical protein